MKAKIKSILSRIADILSLVFGYGIMLSLFIGGLSFFAYLVALIIGGEVAVSICTVIYKGIYPCLVYVTSLFVLLGLLVMYLRGETALSKTKKKKEDIKKQETGMLDETSNVNETVQVEVPTNMATESNTLILETKPIWEDKKNNF